MTSPYVRPDLTALDDLERVLRHLTDELGGWRRRCLKAESELQAVKAQGGMVPSEELVSLRSRLLDLEKENLELRHRIERTRDLITSLRQRVAFVLPDEGEEEGE